MKSKQVLAVAFGFLASSIALGQGQAPPALAPAKAHPCRRRRIQEKRPCSRRARIRRRSAAPAGRPGPGGPPPPPAGPREYTVTEIPGVIAAGQQWKFVWQEAGNNGDGIIGTKDGGLLLAQNDNSAVVKLDKNGKTSVVYTDTNTGGALSMNTKGALFIVERGLQSVASSSSRRRARCWPTGTRAIPRLHRRRAQRPHGRQQGRRLLHDGRRSIYANPNGQVTRYGENLHTNGIILSPDEKTLYVTNGPTVAAFDVQPDGSLTNQREFAKLEGGGRRRRQHDRRGGPPLRHHRPGVQVIGPDGKNLGLIPTPRGVISVRLRGQGQEDALHPGPRRQGLAGKRSRQRRAGLFDFHDRSGLQETREVMLDLFGAVSSMLALPRVRRHADSSSHA